MTHKKIKYKSGNMPFSVYSSSVDAGYQITNLHEDTYAGIKDAPLQGPFTYQYVGGNQHRHIPLNDGTDTIESRPELFNISFSASGEIRVVGNGGAFLSGASTEQDVVTFYMTQDSLNTASWWSFEENLTTGVTSSLTELFDYTGLPGAPDHMGPIAVDVDNEKLYSYDRDTEDYYSIGFDGTGHTTIVMANGSKPPSSTTENSLVVLPSLSKLIFATGSGGTFPQGIATSSLVGAADGLIYNGISINAACAFAYSTTTDKLYFRDDGNIRSCSLDGTNEGIVCTDNLGGLWCRGMAVDETNERLYWAIDAGSSDGRIFSASLDGAISGNVLIAPVDNIQNLQVYGDTLYFQNEYYYNDTGIWTSSLDGATFGEWIPEITNMTYFGKPVFSGTVTVPATLVPNPRFHDPRSTYTRGEVAKRPVNIANHQTYNPIGNYSASYEIIQTAGRSTNNRAFVEQLGVGFIGDPALPHNGALVTQFVSGARSAERELPDFSGQYSNKFVFVNRFNAPGGTDVSSRGVLDTYAEEFAPNNTINLRNNAVRSGLRSQLRRHTPKPGTLPILNNDPFNAPTIATQYHSDYRNPRYKWQDYPDPIEDVITGLSEPTGIAIDSAAGKIYWADSSDRTLSRANTDGSDREVLYTVATTTNMRTLKLDIPNGKMYWTDSGASYDAVMQGNMDGSGAIQYFLDESTGGTKQGIGIDFVHKKLYWTDQDSPDLIQRADFISGAMAETMFDASGTATMGGISIDPAGMKMYWADQGGSYDRILRAGLNIPDGELPTTRTDVETIIDRSGSSSAFEDVILDLLEEKIYFTDTTTDQIQRANFDGTEIETMFVDAGASRAKRLALDTDAGKLYWTDFDLGVIRRCNISYKKVYDNAYVTHQVPRSALDYAWIKAAALTNKLQLPGYQNSSSYYGGPFTDIEFVLSGAYDRGDFLAISGSMIDKSQISVETPLGSTNFLSTSANTFLNAYNGPYQWASWQCARNSYHPVVRQLARESILSLEDPPELLTPTPWNVDGNPYQAWGKIKNYKESNVSGDSKPIRHEVQAFADQSPPGPIFDGTYTYSNAFATLTRTELRNRLGMIDLSPATMYPYISGWYLPSGQLNFMNLSFHRLQYSQILYPALLNAFLNETRTRTNYEEIPGTGSDGYDRIFGTQRTFYKSNKIRTLGVAENSQGYTAAPIGPTGALVDSLNFNPMATDGIRSYPDSGSYRNYNGELMMDTELSIIRHKPVPSLAFNELNYVINASGTITASSGYVERLTEQITGRNPWYDTYKEYAADVRPHAKNMSILPEFRISEFMKYYVDTNNFQDINNSFLTLEGAAITSSAQHPTASVDISFLEKYVYSSKSERFSKIATDHKPIASITHLALTCSALKKLLPQEGFYPANRTIQLGNILSESVGPHIFGKEEGNVEGNFPAEGLQGLLKPLMSPGILYNSIKSGIAVDYPIYTASIPGTVYGETSPSDFRLTAPPTYRLPFESLINLTQYLPVGTLPTVDDPAGTNPIRLASSFATASTGLTIAEILKYKFYWDGNKSPLFELAMHNFLAETVDFFLEGEGGGKLKTFRSSPISVDGVDISLGPSDEDKTYYMDVVLNDSVEMSKFVEYDGIKTWNDVYWMYSPTPVPGEDFGHRSKMVSGSDGLYALIGAPALFGVGDGYGTAYLYKYTEDGFGWRHQLTIPGPATVGDIPVDWSGDGFGEALDMVSGSDGLYFIVGAWRSGGWKGRAYVYHTTHDTLISRTLITSSDLSGDDWYGRSVAITSGSDRIWFAVGAPGDNGPTAGGGSPGNVGVVYLYNSASEETADPFSIGNGLPLTQQHFQCRLTSSATKGSQYVGYEGLAIVSGAETIHVLAGEYDNTTLAGGMGSASLWSVGPVNTANSYPYGSGLMDNAVALLTLTASDMADWVADGDTTKAGAYNPHFGGRDVGMISSSLGLYTSVFAFTGANQGYVGPTAGIGPWNPGRVYVYNYNAPLSSTSVPDHTWVLTGSEDVDYYEMRLGERHQIISGSESEGLYLAAGVYCGGASGTSSDKGPFICQVQEGVTVPITSSLPFPVSPAGNVSGGCLSHYGNDISVISSSVHGEKNAMGIIVGADLGDIFNEGTTVDNAGFTVLHTGTYAGGFTTSASYTDRLYKYKQHGKLFGLAIEEAFPETTQVIGAYDPAYCAYTPPPFYGEAIARISFTPPEARAYTLGEVFNSAQVENILNLNPDRVAIINNASASLTSLQEEVKMPVSSSVNLFGKTKIPGTTTLPNGQTVTVDSTESDPDAWVISTRFECPVLDMSSSKYNELYTANNDMITGTFGWQTTLNAEVLVVSSSALIFPHPMGIVVDEIHKYIYWTDRTVKHIFRSNIDGTDAILFNNSDFGTALRGIDIDGPNGMLYVCIGGGGTPKIMRVAAEENAPIEELITAGIGSVAEDLVLDLDARMIYWTGNDEILKAGMDIPAGETAATRTDIEVVSDDSSIDGPFAIALDTVEGKIYWIADGAPDPNISRCNLDGSDVEFIVADTDTSFEGMALDRRLGKVYWASSITGYIMRKNSDGTGPEEEMVLNPGNCEGMTIPESMDQMFWVSNAAGGDPEAVMSAHVDLHSEHNPRTMWTSYGTVPSPEKSLSLELRDSFPNSEDPATGSLIDIFGFEGSPKKVGAMRSEKEVWEAIIAIPYLESPDSNIETTLINGRYYIKLDQMGDAMIGGGAGIGTAPTTAFDLQRKNLNDGLPAVTATQNPAGVDIQSTTITDMIKGMNKYVIPPHMDFIKYPPITPFAMYFLELKHVLTQNELVDIWQGITPDSALKVEKEEITIGHDINQFEFFGGVNDPEIFAKLRFFVFKVKKRGKQNYYKITEDSTDDERYRFEFANDGFAAAVPPQGSYNWPYDFFSLIETANIEVRYNLKVNPPVPPPEEPLTGSPGIGGGG